MATKTADNKSHLLSLSSDAWRELGFYLGVVGLCKLFRVGSKQLSSALSRTDFGSLVFPPRLNSGHSPIIPAHNGLSCVTRMLHSNELVFPSTSRLDIPTLGCMVARREVVDTLEHVSEDDVDSTWMQFLGSAQSITLCRGPETTRFDTFTLKELSISQVTLTRYLETDMTSERVKSVFCTERFFAHLPNLQVLELNFQGHVKHLQFDFESAPQLTTFKLILSADHDGITVSSGDALTHLEVTTYFKYSLLDTKGVPNLTSLRLTQVEWPSYWRAHKTALSKTLTSLHLAVCPIGQDAWHSDWPPLLRRLYLYSVFIKPEARSDEAWTEAHKLSVKRGDLKIRCLNPSKLPALLEVLVFDGLEKLEPAFAAPETVRTWNFDTQSLLTPRQDPLPRGGYHTGNNDVIFYLAPETIPVGIIPCRKLRSLMLGKSCLFGSSFSILPTTLAHLSLNGCTPRPTKNVAITNMIFATLFPKALRFLPASAHKRILPKLQVLDLGSFNTKWSLLLPYSSCASEIGISSEEAFMASLDKNGTPMTDIEDQGPAKAIDLTKWVLKSAAAAIGAEKEIDWKSCEIDAALVVLGSLWDSVVSRATSKAFELDFELPHNFSTLTVVAAPVGHYTPLPPSIASIASIASSASSAPATTSATTSTTTSATTSTPTNSTSPSSNAISTASLIAASSPAPKHASSPASNSAPSARSASSAPKQTSNLPSKAIFAQVCHPFGDHFNTPLHHFLQSPFVWPSIGIHVKHLELLGVTRIWLLNNHPWSELPWLHSLSISLHFQSGPSNNPQTHIILNTFASKSLQHLTILAPDSSITITEKQSTSFPVLESLTMCESLVDRQVSYLRKIAPSLKHVHIMPFISDGGRPDFHQSRFWRQYLSYMTWMRQDSMQALPTASVYDANTANQQLTNYKEAIKRITEADSSVMEVKHAMKIGLTTKKAESMQMAAKSCLIFTGASWVTIDDSEKPITRKALRDASGSMNKSITLASIAKRLTKDIFPGSSFHRLALCPFLQDWKIPSGVTLIDLTEDHTETLEAWKDVGTVPDFGSADEPRWVYSADSNFSIQLESLQMPSSLTELRLSAIVESTSVDIFALLPQGLLVLHIYNQQPLGLKKRPKVKDRVGPPAAIRDIYAPNVLLLGGGRPPINTWPSSLTRLVCHTIGAAPLHTQIPSNLKVVIIKGSIQRHPYSNTMPTIAPPAPIPAPAKSTAAKKAVNRERKSQDLEKRAGKIPGVQYSIPVGGPLREKPPPSFGRGFSRDLGTHRLQAYVNAYMYMNRYEPDSDSDEDADADGYDMW